MTSLIVVPCFNEEKRLSSDAFATFVERNPGIDFLFVNDGSRDGTLGVLQQLATRAPERLRVLNLEKNSGKAEAVRRGMLEGFRSGATTVGYFDADLATPLDEIPRFQEVLSARPECTIVLGSRVKLLGRQIDRRPVRHYLGRVFATVASSVLSLPVYDTQCGAKLFRNTAENAALFTEPFLTGWIFDVEILARLIVARKTSGGPVAAALVVELPLNRWVDVPGSKVKAKDFLRALREMWRIRRHYFRRR